MGVSEESEDLKLLFIQEELDQHGEWLCDVLSEEIEKKRLVQSRLLQESLGYSQFSQGNNPGLRMKFFSYGRAFEIAGYKKKRENKWNVNTNRLIWGVKERRYKRKDTKWYAKNMYGGLNRLISRIMYGLSDTEIARLKGILEERKMK